MKNKIKKIKPRIPTGFVELLPGDQIAFNKFLDIIRNTYEEYGFVPQETPLVEEADVLLSKSGGETEKQIYTLKKGDEDLALRFDLTVPLARYVAEYYPQLNFPYRRYQIGKVYRGEKPQKGRFREFYQCDIDVVGDGKLSLMNDAEMVSMIYSLFRKMDVGDFVIRINNRKVLSGYIKSLGLEDKESQILRTIDKLEKVGMDKMVGELREEGVDEPSSAKIVELITIEGSNEDKLISLQEITTDIEEFGQGVKELVEVVALVDRFGVPEESFQVDLSIARGLGYYTGTVYETRMKNKEISGSVCSGGRYDNLAENFSDKKLPGVGISIGLTRLFSQLKSVDLVKEGSSTVSQVVVIPMEETRTDTAIETARVLRESGIKAEIYSEEGKLRKKLNYVNKVGAPWLVLIGENEEKENKVTIKNMTSGEQWTTGIEEAVKIIKPEK